MSPEDQETALRSSNSDSRSQDEGGAQESNASSSTSRRRTLDAILESHHDEDASDVPLEDEQGAVFSTRPIASSSNFIPAPAHPTFPSSTTRSASTSLPSESSNDNPSTQPHSTNPTVNSARRPRMTLDQLATREMNRPERRPTATSAPWSESSDSPEPVPERGESNSPPSDDDDDDPDGDGGRDDEEAAEPEDEDVSSLDLENSSVVPDSQAGDEDQDYKEKDADKPVGTGLVAENEVLAIEEEPDVPQSVPGPETADLRRVDGPQDAESSKSTRRRGTLSATPVASALPLSTLDDENDEDPDDPFLLVAPRTPGRASVPPSASKRSVSRAVDGPGKAEFSRSAQLRPTPSHPDSGSHVEITSYSPPPAPLTNSRPTSRSGSAAPEALTMTDKELSRQRYASSVRLLTTWEDIVHRYKDLPADEDDEIDLRTGKLVRDRGKLKKMKGTRRFGFFSGFLIGGDEDVEVEDEDEGDEEKEGRDPDQQQEEQPTTSRKRSRSASVRGGSVGPSTSRPNSRQPSRRPSLQPSRQPSLTPSDGFFAARQRPQIDPADLKAFLAENAILMADFVDEEDDFSGIDEVTVYGGDTDRESVYGRTDVESGNDMDEDDSSDAEEISATSFHPRVKSPRPEEEGQEQEVASVKEVVEEPSPVVESVEEVSASENEQQEQQPSRSSGKGKEREVPIRASRPSEVVQASRVAESSESEEDATEETRIQPPGPSRKGKEREIQSPPRRTSPAPKRPRVVSDDDEEEEEAKAPAQSRSSSHPAPRPLSPRPPKKKIQKPVDRPQWRPSPPPAALPPSHSNNDFEPILPDRPTVAGFPTIHWHHDELPKITDLPILKLKDIYAPNFRYGTSSWTSISPHILFNLPRDYDPVNPPADRHLPTFNEDAELPGGAVVYAPSRQVVKSRESVLEAATRDAQKRRRMKNVERERKLAERREQEKRAKDSMPKFTATSLARTSEGRWIKKEERKDDEPLPSAAEVEERTKGASPPVASSSRIPMPSSHGGPSNSNRQPLRPSNPPGSSSRNPLSRSNLAVTSSWAAEVSSLLNSKPPVPPAPPPSAFAPPNPRLSAPSTSSLKSTNTTNKPFCHSCLTFGRDLVAAVCPGRQSHHRCTGGDPKVVQLAYPGQCLRCLFQGREEESKTCLGGRLGNTRCDSGGREMSKRTSLMKEREERRVEREERKKKKTKRGAGKEKGKGNKRRRLWSDDGEEEEGGEEEREFDDEHETTEEEEVLDGGEYSGVKAAVPSTSSKRKTRSSARFGGEDEEGGGAD